MKQNCAAMLACLIAASVLATGLAWGPRPAAAPNSAGAVAQAIVWSQDLAGGGTWQEVAQQAAASTEGGSSDWRLPTFTELQNALINGTFGSTNWPNANGVLIWSASGSKGTGVGSWAYCCRLYTDGAGNPIAPSGVARVKEYKNGLRPAKFVRP